MRSSLLTEMASVIDPEHLDFRQTWYTALHRIVQYK